MCFFPPFVPVLLRIVQQLAFHLPHSLMSLNKQSSLFNFFPLLPRDMLAFFADEGSVAAEITSIRDCHAWDFAFLHWAIESQHHLLGLYNVTPVVAAVLMLGSCLWHIWLSIWVVRYQFFLIFFELQFEAEIWADIWSNFPHKFEGIAEHRVIFFHVVGNDEGRWLDKVKITLEMPAPQWTSTPPRFKSGWQ